MIIILPAIILNSKELLKIKEPKKVAVAPKLIKTMEKPKVNKTIGNILIVFFLITHLKNFQKYKIYIQVLMEVHMETKSLSIQLQMQQIILSFNQYFS